MMSKSGSRETCFNRTTSRECFAVTCFGLIVFKEVKSRVLRASRGRELRVGIQRVMLQN